MLSSPAEDQVRRTPLTPDELDHYRERGYIVPGRLLSDAEIAFIAGALQEYLDERLEAAVRYDFGATRAPMPVSVLPRSAYERQGLRNAAGPETTEADRSVPVLINLWEKDERFHEVVRNPVAAGWAAQLLEAADVLLYEDTAFVKPPSTGGSLVWHADASFYPTATPDVIGCWIALDDVDAENGTMQYAVGSHHLGEVLPVEFRRGSSIMGAERPGVPEIGDPIALGMEIVDVVLKKGQCVYHHPLLWHASGTNDSTRPRHAFAVRYIKQGTVWLGNQRYRSRHRPDDLMEFPVPGPVTAGKQFPRLAQAF